MHQAMRGRPPAVWDRSVADRERGEGSWGLCLEGGGKRGKLHVATDWQEKEEKQKRDRDSRRSLTHQAMRGPAGWVSSLANRERGEGS